MAGEIIRKGDKTDHDGTVLEGSMFDICMGKPISYIGHKVHCPKCKGDFPIVEGVLTSSFYGKGVALAGMKTSCGAILIASQFTDTVEWSNGVAGNSSNTQRSAKPSPTITAASSIAKPATTTEEAAFDLFFHAKDEKTGANLINSPYRITLSDGTRYVGVTDENGYTQKVYANTPQTATIEIPYHDHDHNGNTHAASQSGTCSC